MAIKSREANYNLWDYGEWLQEYMSEGLREWNLRELADRAIELLNIDYTIDELDKTFYYISEVEKYNIEKSDIFVDWTQLIAKINSDFENRIKDKSGDLLEWDKSNAGILRGLEYTILSNLNGFRGFINSMLVKLNKTKTPWEHYFVAVDGMGKLDMDMLFQQYEQLTNTFIVSGNKYQKIRKFVSTAHTAECFFLWDTVISHIFINFLSLGGQDYYGYCEYCGKFFLIQRKGKKRFCKNTCRALASRDSRKGKK